MARFVALLINSVFIANNQEGLVYGVTGYGFSTTDASIKYAIASPSGGAPEIDGSLAPKVGFLLGCLFLMFGRKKQNTEVLMAA